MNEVHLRHRLLSQAEEESLARRWREQGDREAREELIRCNLALAVSFAHQYWTARSRLTRDDAIGEAFLGLVLAVDHYEPARKIRLSTYAKYWVRMRITQAIWENSLVQVPHWINRPRASLEQAGVGRRHGGLDRLLRLGHRARQAASDLEEYHNLPSQEPDPLTVASAAESYERLFTALAQLPPLSQCVIRAHYGLSCDRPRSLSAIGRALGWSHARVRRLVAETLRQLRDLLTDPDTLPMDEAQRCADERDASCSSDAA